MDKSNSKYIQVTHNRKVESMRNQLYAYDQDADKTQRLLEQECKYCYYIVKNQIGLDILTDSICKECGIINTYQNSNTDNYCIKCAKEHNICKHCGSILD